MAILQDLGFVEKTFDREIDLHFSCLALSESNARVDPK
jgi:hypothetical protein